MGKTQIINEIIKIYDENNDLKYKLNQTNIAAAANSGISELSQADPFIGLTTVCLDAGRKCLWKAVIDSYELNSYKVYIYENKTNVFIEFDNWCGLLGFNIINNHAYDAEEKYYITLLRNYSISEITEYFRPELKEVYDKNVTDRKMELMRNAKENND